MKATDLMIGDWVTFRDVTDAPIKIQGINGDDTVFGFIFADNEIALKEISLGKIIGISLTPEILEKNGWHKFQMYYRLGIDKQQYMEYYPHLGILRRIYKHKNNKEEVVFTCSALSYVHLLQHALKLCGIDKEITL